MHLHVIQRETARQLNLPRFFTGKPCKRGNIAERRTSTAACLCIACKDYYRDQRVAAEAAAPERLVARAERDRKYRQDNPDKIKQRKRRYYEANRELIIGKAEDYARRNKEKVSTRMRAYMQARSGEIRARKRERYLANRDAILAKMRTYYVENCSKVRIRQKRFRRENRALIQELNAKTRAARKKCVPPWFNEFDRFVVEEAYSLCRDRASATGIEWHVDHMIPMQAKIACGLHCGLNLQVIPAYINCWKRNRMVLTAPDEWLANLS